MKRVVGEGVKYQSLNGSVIGRHGLTRAGLGRVGLEDVQRSQGQPQQRKFLLEEFLPYQLSVTSHLVSKLVVAAYPENVALKIPEWRLIAVLGETKGCSQQALRIFTEMDKMTVSRAASALVRRKLAVKSPFIERKNSHFLKLSKAGERLYAEIIPRALQFEASLLARLDKPDIEACMRVMNSLRSVALELRHEAKALQDPKSKGFCAKRDAMLAGGRRFQRPTIHKRIVAPANRLSPSGKYVARPRSFVTLGITTYSRFESEFDNRQLEEFACLSRSSMTSPSELSTPTPRSFSTGPIRLGQIVGLTKKRGPNLVLTGKCRRCEPG